jgi:hypothetical protein
MVPTVTAKLALQRVPRYLDASLFPDAPPPPRITLWRAVICAALAVAGVAIQMARIWPGAPLNSIWVEDGAVWLPDAMHRGFLDAVTTPYDGFVQTLSRLVAEPVAALPVGWFAAAMAISGAAIVTGCAFVVWRASAGHIETPYLRAALAAMVVLLPVAGTETLDNVTNSIWYLLFACFWLLLWRPATFARAGGAAALAFLGAASNIGALVLLPLWLLRLVAARDRRDWVIVGAFAAGVAMQLVLSWNEIHAHGEPGNRPSAAFSPYLHPHWHWSLVPAYAPRIVGGAVIGQRITGFLWEHLGTPLEVVLGAILLAFVASALVDRNPRTRVLIPLAVATSLGLFLVSGYWRWGRAGEVFVWPHGAWNWGGSHYMVFPALLLLSAIFVQLDAARRFRSGAVWARLRGGMVVCVLLAALVSFRISDAASRGNPRWSGALDFARSQCVRERAASVDVPVAPRILGFSMPLSCTALDGPASRSLSSAARR